MAVRPALDVGHEPEAAPEQQVLALRDLPLADVVRRLATALRVALRDEDFGRVLSAGLLLIITGTFAYSLGGDWSIVDGLIRSAEIMGACVVGAFGRANRATGVCVDPARSYRTKQCRA